MATSTNSRNLMLSSASSRTVTNQKSLTVSATTPTFLYTGTGALSGTPVIAITATKQNTLAPVVWSTSGYSVVLYSAAVGGTAVTIDAAVSTSSTVYLRGVDFSAQSLNSLRVVASVTDVDVLSDSITITKLQSGLSGNSTYTATVYFQNPLNPVGIPPATPSGGSYNFNTASLTAPVSWTVNQPATSTVPTWACTYTFVGAPIDTVNAGPWNAVYLEALNGTNGTNGTRTAVLDLYQWASTAPTVLPSGSSTYTWDTAQFTNPATLNSWTQTPGAGVAGQTLYTIAQTYADTATSTTTNVTWGTPTIRVVGVYGSSGLNGTRTAFLEVYQWALTTPTVFPSGTSTYTWATGGFTAPTTPSSWSLTPGASTAGYTLYACSIRYSDTLTTATTSVTWNTSTTYAVGAAGGNGTNGEWRDLIQLYGFTTTAPTSVTYTFSTNSISTTPNWSLTQPASSTTPTYMTTAVASTSTPTVGVVLTSWSTPVVVAQNGAAGAEGTKSITISIFKWSATAITTPPAQAFTYTWASGVISALPSTWATSAPSSTATGETLYQVNLIISAVVSATTTSTNWSSGIVSRIGYREDGSIGPTGDSARVAYVVTTRITPPTTPTAGTANGGDTIPTSTVTNIDGSTAAWSFSATSVLAAGQYMYQVDGIYKPLSTTIVWGTPYLSNLKVGSLSALAVDTGNLTVSSVGSIKNVGGGYGSTGFFLGYDSTAYKFSVGSGTSMLTWNGTTLSVPAATITGTLTASQIDTRGLSIKDANGNIILAAGTALAASNITPDSGWLNSNVIAISLVNKSGMTVIGNTAEKTGNTDAVWDSSFVSKDSYTSGAYVSFVPQQANKYLMVGLTTDPDANNSYATIDYAMYVQQDGSLSAYENGAGGTPLTSYVAGDVLAVTYDGSNVRYLKNGTVIRTNPATITAPLFVDSSFHGMNGKVSNIQFGPMSSNSWTAIGLRPKMFRAMSRGNSDTAAPFAGASYSTGGILDAETDTIIQSGSNMYTVGKILRSTGAYTFVGHYNPLSGALGGTGEATAMANALNALDSTYIVVVTTWDEPSSNRTLGGLPAAMYRCGASPGVFGSKMVFRGAYILVGIPGCGSGNGIEVYSGETSAATTAWCELAFSVYNGDLIVSGSKSQPKIDATSAPVYIADAAIGYLQVGELKAQNIEAGAISAQKINITQGSITGRIEINSNQIVVYDPAGNIRVKIGSLA